MADNPKPIADSAPEAPMKAIPPPPLPPPNRIVRSGHVPPPYRPAEKYKPKR
jgi:hypothetical protein